MLPRILAADWTQTFVVSPSTMTVFNAALSEHLVESRSDEGAVALCDHFKIPGLSVDAWIELGSDSTGVDSGSGSQRHSAARPRQDRTALVTSPNMAGKSTFLKAVGIAVLLAHSGCGVPATAMKFRMVGSLFSSVQITDNLSAGESFYLAEYVASGR